MPEQEGIVSALKRYLGAFVSLVTTGSLHAESAASKARSADVLLDHVQAAAEHDTQKILSVVDEGLTHYQSLLNKRERQRGIVNDWDAKVKATVAKIKSLPADSPDRTDWEKVAKEALNEKMRAEERLKTLDAEIEDLKPHAEAALNAAEQAGLRKEQALDQRDSLKVENASAVARRALVDAVAAGGSELTATMDEARTKVEEAMARAQAGEQIAEVLPQSPGQVGAKIDAMTRQSRVDDEFARLMGEGAAEPTAKQ
jgi:phage shock protein A